MSIPATRRAVALVVLLGGVALAVVLTLRVVHRTSLPLGARRPPLVYRDPAGAHELQNDGRETLLLFVSSRCAHCDYELSELASHANELSAVRLVLVSIEPDLFSTGLPARRPALSPSSHVLWGVVDRAAFARDFGAAATPTAFLFDSRGRLENRVVGEARVDVLLAPPPVARGS